jgi:predicted Rossmann fold flavoprotein
VPSAAPGPNSGFLHRPTDATDVAIVGGGAAGLATAIFAARRLPGVRIAVFDGARHLGAKILVSGGGRCNVTNRVVTAGDYWGGDRRVIDSVLRAFSAADAVALFESLAVKLHEEDAGKLFPDSGNARTVVRALLDAVAQAGVVLNAGCRVESVRTGTTAGFVVHGHGWSTAAQRVVLATGGLSLPKTGSDGGGLAMAASLGHRVVPTTPALVPLVLDGAFHSGLSGVSHEAALSIAGGGLRTITLRGPLLWTHFGASGPVVLDASRHWHRAKLEGRDVEVRLSFVPSRDFAGVERLLLHSAADRPAAMLRTILSEHLPVAVAERLADAVAIDSDTRLARLSREDRRRLAHALVSWPLQVTGSRGYNYAEVTAGGVALDEVNRGTMESRVCPGLFLVGEVLDVDGRLGGFNFQWAWSSAYVAARALARTFGGERSHG